VASLRVDDDNIIFQHTKDFPFYFDPDDVDRVRGNGIAVEDSIPVVSGKYKLIVLLQNSVGKEFSMLEKEIIVPAESDLPRIFGPLLGYKVQTYRNDLHIPFKTLDRKVVIDPKNTFSATENISFAFAVSNVSMDLWEKGKVRVLIQGLKPNEPSKKTFLLNLKDYPYRKVLSIEQTISARDLSPDYYRLELDLIDENGEEVDGERGPFIVSQAEAISHPITHSKAFPLTNNFYFYYVLAQQYNKINNNESAEFYYEKAYGLRPDNKRGLIEYSNFLYKIKKFDRILELIKGLEGDENLKFEYFLLKGKALMGKGQYDEAIDSFLEGNKIYNSDISLLNSLGFCYYRIGENKMALDALNASLRLNSGQEDIKKLVAEIEKK
jgi:tetratricopeptide (TPR) repeat protein